jgi:negative regulator of sigma E activity
MTSDNSTTPPGDRDELVSAALDGEVSADEIARVAREPELRRRREQFESVRRQLSGHDPLPHSTLEAAVTRAVRAASEQVEPPAGPAGDLHRHAHPAQTRRRFGHPRVLAAAVVAALLTLGGVAVALRPTGSSSTLAASSGGRDGDAGVGSGSAEQLAAQAHAALADGPTTALGGGSTPPAAHPSGPNAAGASTSSSIGSPPSPSAGESGPASTAERGATETSQVAGPAGSRLGGPGTDQRPGTASDNTASAGTTAPGAPAAPPGAADAATTEPPIVPQAGATPAPPRSAVDLGSYRDADALVAELRATSDRQLAGTTAEPPGPSGAPQVAFDCRARPAGELLGVARLIDSGNRTVVLLRTGTSAAPRLVGVDASNCAPVLDVPL